MMINKQVNNKLLYNESVGDLACVAGTGFFRAKGEITRTLVPPSRVLQKLTKMNHNNTYLTDSTTCKGKKMKPPQFLSETSHSEKHLKYYMYISIDTS